MKPTILAAFLLERSGHAVVPARSGPSKRAAAAASLAARLRPYRKFKAGSSLMSMMVMNSSWARSSMISGVTSSSVSRVLW